jgi:hypothetical protein
VIAVIGPSDACHPDRSASAIFVAMATPRRGVEGPRESSADHTASGSSTQDANSRGCIHQLAPHPVSSRPERLVILVPTTNHGAEWRDPERARLTMQPQGVLTMHCFPYVLHFVTRGLVSGATIILGRTPCSNMAEETSSGSLHSAPLIFSKDRRPRRSGRDNTGREATPLGSPSTGLGVPPLRAVDFFKGRTFQALRSG